MACSVFLSYSTKDLARVKALARALEADGIGCWFADRDIPKGETWPPRISEALRLSEVVAVVLSGASNVSREVQREVALANAENKPVLCLRVEDVTLDPTLRYLLALANWMDVLAGGLATHHERIRTALRALLETTRAGLAATAPSRGSGPERSPAQVALEQIVRDLSLFQDRVLMLAAVMAERPSVLVMNNAAFDRLVRAAEDYNRDLPPLVTRLGTYGAIVQRYWGPGAAGRFEALRTQAERDIYRGAVFDMNEERGALNAYSPEAPPPPEVEAELAATLARKTARVRQEVGRLTDSWAGLQADMARAL